MVLGRSRFQGLMRKAGQQFNVHGPTRRFRLFGIASSFDLAAFWLPLLFGLPVAFHHASSESFFCPCSVLCGAMEFHRSDSASVDEHPTDGPQDRHASKGHLPVGPEIPIFPMRAS